MRSINVVESTEKLATGRAGDCSLKPWKAKPRSIHTVRVPINFLVHCNRMKLVQS